MDINTCFETTSSYHAIAYYSHLFPLLITIAVSSFIVIKSKFSHLSLIFTAFTSSFCLWLIGDVVAWTSSNYNLVSFVWAPLDYINIVFYVLGTYFFVFVVQERGVPKWILCALLILPIPAWWLTFSNQTISIMYQPVCEALNNEWLSQYKFVVEVAVIAFVMLFGFFSTRKATKKKKMQTFIVALALVLFFSIFGVTEYIASQTGVYEINLYSLFVIPVFFFIIIYAITNLEILHLRLIGSQMIPLVLISMVASQFLFIEKSVNKVLTAITLVLSVGFGIILMRSGRREEKARITVEKLATELQAANEQLKDLDHQKDELLGIVSHQLAKPITAIKWNIESLLDGDSGALNKEQKEVADTMQTMATDLSDLTSMILDVSRVQLGRMKLDSQPLDLNAFFKEILSVIEPTIKEKKIEFVQKISPKTLPTVLLDKRYTRMTVENLLSNAVKYTPEKGTVTLDIEITKGVLHCKIIDTGIGIPKAEQHKIFGKMYRASNVQNVHEGNGFGLYVAKGAIEGQGGKIGFSSTEGKGTTFWFTLPIHEAPETKA